MAVSAIGADIGALEIILAYRENLEPVRYVAFPLSDGERIMSELGAFSGRVVPAVGSGAWRLSESIQLMTGALIEKHREPLCVWSAIEHLLSKESTHNDAFRLDHSRVIGSSHHSISAPYPSKSVLEAIRVPVHLADLQDSFPILLVNIKSGSSFYRIDSPNEIVRVGGSSIGASTISALGRRLLDTASVSEIVSDALKLEHASKADLLVEDIYGGDCDSIGLPGSIIASCFGKANNASCDSPDIAKSLIDLMCINTAQLASLHARLNRCATVVIVGSIGDSLEVAECIQRVLNVLPPKDSPPIRAVFFKHSRYLGCLGALLRRERLAKAFSAKLSNVPLDTATVADGVDDETYTKLRVCTPLSVDRTDRFSN